MTISKSAAYHHLKAIIVTEIANSLLYVNSLLIQDNMDVGIPVHAFITEIIPFAYDLELTLNRKS